MFETRRERASKLKPIQPPKHAFLRVIRLDSPSQLELIHVSTSEPRCEGRPARRVHRSARSGQRGERGKATRAKRRSSSARSRMPRAAAIDLPALDTTVILDMMWNKAELLLHASRLLVAVVARAPELVTPKVTKRSRDHGPGRLGNKSAAPIGLANPIPQLKRMISRGGILEPRLHQSNRANGLGGLVQHDGVGFRSAENIANDFAAHLDRRMHGPASRRANLGIRGVLVEGLGIRILPRAKDQAFCFKHHCKPSSPSIPNDCREKSPGLYEQDPRAVQPIPDKSREQNPGPPVRRRRGRTPAPAHGHRIRTHARLARIRTPRPHARHTPAHGHEHKELKYPVHPSSVKYNTSNTHHGREETHVRKVQHHV